ncbi:MAG: DUF4192 domain-containing protein [Mycobacterium sp.]|nr:DUF4192 domain-containing protein [Mycobacterium sp.]
MTKHSFRFTRPGALIAALPAVLGFVPEKSLVLVSLEDGRVGAVMRADLSEDLSENVGRLAEIAANSGAESVVAVVVDADGALCPMCADEHQRLCNTLTEELQSRGVSLYAAHVVDRVEAGGAWHCVDGCGASGTVDDPTSSPLAAAAVLDGRRLYGSRADLRAVIAPADPEQATALGESVRSRALVREEDWQTDPDGRGRRDVEHTISVAQRVLDGISLDNAELAEVACGLTDIAVRDTLYALAVGSVAPAAEALWALLVRRLPDPWRVEALVLLAFSAYARGDGPLAGIALESALRSDPGHRMAGMLDVALQSGMRPEQIRELTGTGYRLAKRLGVNLPPRREFGRAC